MIMPEEKPGEKKKPDEKEKPKKPVVARTPKKKKFVCSECHEVWALGKSNLCPKCGTPGLETVIS